MTDLVGRTLDRLAESLPGQVSTPGDASYGAATAIWSNRSGACSAPSSTARRPMTYSRPFAPSATAVFRCRSAAEFPDEHRGFLPDDRCLVPLTVLLWATFALWLLVYLVAAVVEATKTRALGAAAP
jgi:hypothetical protein